MKKFLAFFLAVCILWTMVSCKNNLVYIDDATDENEEFSSMEKSWVSLSKYGTSDSYAQKVYEYGNKFVETEYAIVFVDTRDNTHLSYINKKNGDVRILCGDPLCKHTESEMCSAVCDVSTASSLVYSPDNGRLYFVRRNDIMASPQTRYSTIVSIDIDNMDFTVKQHYSLTPGNEITSMKYSGGKLYFSYIITEDDTEKLMLSSLSISDSTTENVCHFDYINTRYIIQDGIIYYYNTGDNILYTYNTLTNTNITFVNTKSINKYFVSKEYLYYQTPDSIARVRLSDQQNTTIFKSKGISSDFDCTTDSSGNIYFYGYTPEIVETSRGQMTNYSGGKVFRISDSSEELYIELEKSTFIKSICAIQNIIFIETYTYNANKKTENTYYYVYDGTIHKLPDAE